MAVLVQIFGLDAIELLGDLKGAKKDFIFTDGRTDLVLRMSILLPRYTNGLFIEFICCRLATGDSNNKTVNDSEPR